MMNGRRQRLRFGVCGLGFMGRTHFAHLRNHAGAEVVAVCDRDPRRRAGDLSTATGNIGPSDAERLDLSGVAAYESVAELVGDPQVDAIAITLPTPLHAEVAEAALAAGKHVICEKPMAPDLAACDRMVRAVERAERTLMVAQCIRFWPQYELIKGMVDEGRIGRVRFAKLRRVCTPPAYSSENWLMDGGQSGGALLDLHVHDVDFAHHLLGVPETVYARGCRGPSGGTDHVFASFGYADGRLAWLEGGWTYHAPWPFEMAIVVNGEKGTLEWSSSRGSDVLLYAGDADPERHPCPEGTGWSREMDYFVECVGAGRPVDRCLPSSSRTSIALALAEGQSIESGAAVPIRLSPGGGATL